MPENQVKLEKGTRYKVSIHSPSKKGKSRHVMGTFVGWSQYYNGYVFDCRPEYGDMVLVPGRDDFSVLPASRSL